VSTIIGTPVEIEGIDFALAAYREEGQWQVEELAHSHVEDVEAVAGPVLRHRIIPNFNADAEGITVEQIVEKIVTLIPRGKGERLL